MLCVHIDRVRGLGVVGCRVWGWLQGVYVGEVGGVVDVMMEQSVKLFERKRLSGI